MGNPFFEYALYSRNFPQSVDLFLSVTLEEQELQEIHVWTHIKMQSTNVVNRLFSCISTVRLFENFIRFILNYCV